MRVEIIDITPEIAKNWLANNKNNRSLSSGVAEKYARDMLAGKWTLTHQGIAFYEDMTVADGQHRLNAIILSGVTIKMMVTFDVTKDSSLNIDSLKPRSNLDKIKIEGNHEWINKTVISTINMLISVSGDTSRLLSTSQIIAKSEGKILKSLVYVSDKLSKNRPYLTNAPIYAAVALAHFNGISESLLNNFISVYISGMATDKDDIAAIKLRDYLMSKEGQCHGRVKRIITLKKAQRAIHAFSKREYLSQLYEPKELIYSLPDDF
jgi:hypothetical protein